MRIKTKLWAASLATFQGIDTIIANGKKPQLLYEIIKDNKVGTMFVGKQKIEPLIIKYLLV